MCWLFDRFSLTFQIYIYSICNETKTFYIIRHQIIPTFYKCQCLFGSGHFSCLLSIVLFENQNWYSHKFTLQWLIAEDFTGIKPDIWSTDMIERQKHRKHNTKSEKKPNDKGNRVGWATNYKSFNQMYLQCFVSQVLLKMFRHVWLYIRKTYFSYSIIASSRPS